MTTPSIFLPNVIKWGVGITRKTFGSEKKNRLIIKLFKLNFNYLETYQYKFFFFKKKQVFNLNIEAVNAYESLQLLLAKVSLFLTCKNTA